MKKKTKGLVALGASAALLAGTAGTFALWFDTANLGTEASTISTGDLALTGEGSGSWVWENFSTPQTTLEKGDDFTALHILVPGDAVNYDWDLSAIDLTADGTTLVANLYLDGVGEISVEDIKPLVILIDGEALVEADFTAAIIEKATSESDILESLPLITVGFPLSLDADGNRNPIAPGEDGKGWGRQIANGDISLNSLSLRLTQVATGNYFGASNNG